MTAAIAPSPHWDYQGVQTASHRFCVAPLLDGTTPPCRFLHRRLSRHARLYSEMLFANAVIHRPALIAHQLPWQQPQQHALQLGGSDPQQLAEAAALISAYRNPMGAGYDEINLNCGCPSPRVSSGNFGACLMTQPSLVAQCIAAMRAASTVPISLKHRLGIDQPWPYSQLHDFVAEIAAAGCRIFIVHARIAVLAGLSPKQNRSVPPLQYDYVYRLKADFPDLTIVINGGISNHDEIARHLQIVDGVMLGRHPYHHPSWLTEVDQRYFNSATAQVPRPAEVIQAMAVYARDYPAIPLTTILKPLAHLMSGSRVAKRFRNLASNHALIKGTTDRQSLFALLEELTAAAQAPAP